MQVQNQSNPFSQNTATTSQISASSSSNSISLTAKQSESCDSSWFLPSLRGSLPSEYDGQFGLLQPTSKTTSSSSQISPLTRYEITQEDLSIARTKFLQPFLSCLRAISANCIGPNLLRITEIFCALQKEANNINHSSIEVPTSSSAVAACLAVSEEYVIALLHSAEQALEANELHRALEVLIFTDNLTLTYANLAPLHVTCLMFIAHYFNSAGEPNSAFEVLEEAIANPHFDAHASYFLKALINFNIGLLLKKRNNSNNESKTDEPLRFLRSSAKLFVKANLSCSSTSSSTSNNSNTQSIHQLYSHINYCLALHHIGDEIYESTNNAKGAFDSHFNAFMHARSFLGSLHPLTTRLKRYLEVFAKDIQKAISEQADKPNSADPPILDNPHSYQQITRKLKKVNDPYCALLSTPIPTIQQKLRFKSPNANSAQQSPLLLFKKTPLHKSMKPDGKTEQEELLLTFQTPLLLIDTSEANNAQENIPTTPAAANDSSMTSPVPTRTVNNDSTNNYESSQYYQQNRRDQYLKKQQQRQRFNLNLDQISISRGTITYMPSDSSRHHLSSSLCLSTPSHYFSNGSEVIGNSSSNAQPQPYFFQQRPTSGATKSSSKSNPNMISISNYNSTAEYTAATPMQEYVPLRDIFHQKQTQKQAQSSVNQQEFKPSSQHQQQLTPNPQQRIRTDPSQKGYAKSTSIKNGGNIAAINFSSLSSSSKAQTNNNNSKLAFLPQTSQTPNRNHRVTISTAQQLQNQPRLFMKNHQQVAFADQTQSATATPSVSSSFVARKQDFVLPFKKTTNSGKKNYQQQQQITPFPQSSQ